MVSPYEQLDDRLARLRPLADIAHPPRGWVRAVRTALGMTTAQLAARLGISQPGVFQLEKAEADGGITLNSLERAARALNCRVVYALVPHEPLTATVKSRADAVADRQLASIDQTMQLEAQGVTNRKARSDTKQRLVDGLLRRPTRLWDVP